MRDNINFSTFIRVANVVLGVTNLLLFALWFSLIKRDALPPGGQPADYIFNQLSLNVTILGVLVTAAALLLAALGFFGFQAVMDRAVVRAGEVAQLEAQSYLRSLNTLDQASHPPERQRGAPSTALPSTSGATEESETL